MKNGQVNDVEIIAEKGGEIKIMNPFENQEINTSSPFQINDKIISIKTTPGQKIKMTPK